MWGRILSAAAKGVSVTLPAVRTNPAVSIHLSTGRLARLAPSSALLTANETTILATLSQSAPTPSSFLPLLVDFRAKAAGVGVIPGTWTRRELQPTSQETLIARLIDRTLRPALSAPNLNLPPTQLTVSVLSSAQVPSVPIDALAVNAAAAAIAASGIECQSVGAARVALIDGEIVPFPSDQELENADVSVFVAVNPDGNVLSLSVTGGRGATEEALLMQVVNEGVEIASRILKLQDEFREAAREMRTKEGKSAFPRQMPRPPGGHEDAEFQITENILDDIRSKALEVYRNAFVESRQFPGKAHRAEVMTRAQQNLVDAFTNLPMDILLKIAKPVAKEAHRDVLLKDGVRMDGRRFDEIRLIRCETGVLPGDVHGSAIFERGDTQVLACSTIGLKSQAMRTEKYVTGGGESKSFFVHYSFPPYSTGEYGRFAGVASRREIGHSDLAERAIRPLLAHPHPVDPSEKRMWSGVDDPIYPYVHRLSAEVMASDGSSSMATVCAGSMALMHSGAPLQSAVAGVAMGLITGSSSDSGDDSNHVILTDILGAEDHFGDMDMKVSGTADGITACQLDVKPHSGLPTKIIEKALFKAREARVAMLAKMAEAITGLEDLPSHAPRVAEIPVDHDTAVKTLMRDRATGLREIEDTCDANLTYDGRKRTIKIEAPSLSSCEAAIRMIRDAMKHLEIGAKVTGTVTEVKHTYAVVTIAAGNMSGLLHVSKMHLSPVGHATGVKSTAKDEADDPHSFSSTALRYPDVRLHVSPGDTFEVVVLESDRSKNILRFGLCAPLASVSNSKAKLEDQIDSILSAAMPKEVRAK